MAYGRIAIIGPREGASAREVREALELLDIEQGFTGLLVLDIPGVVRDVVTDYAASGRKALSLLPIPYEEHGNNAYVSAMWHLLERTDAELLVLLGPLDPSVHTSLTLATHKQRQVWIPWPLT